MTKMELSFASLIFVLLLAMAGCGQNPPETDNMASHSMTPANEPQMNGTTTNAMETVTPSHPGHMESNNMNTANPPPLTGNMMSDSVTASNQSQMNDMTTNSMNKMAAPQTGKMESH